MVALLGATASLAQTLQIDGRVVDPQGEPLAEARVVLQPLESFGDQARQDFEGAPVPPVAETTSDAAGRFVFEAPEVGFYRVRIEHAGHGPRFLDLNPLLDHRSLPIARLRQAEDLKVVVRDAGGQPIEARLAMEQVQEETRFQRFFSNLTWNLAPLRATTSEDGRATLAIELGPASWRLEVVAPGHRAEERRLRVGAPPQRITLSAGAPLSVRVVDAAGDPVAEALVGGADQVLPWSRTDAEGLAEIRVSGAEPFELWALAADGPTGRSTVPAEREPEEVFEIGLEPLYQIAGQVREAETRRPIPGALVWIDGDVTHGFARSDGSGHYAVATRSKEGSIQAAAVGFTEENGRFSDPRAEPGGTLGGPTLDLSVSCWVSGRVVDEESRGVPDAEIYLEMSWQGRKFAEILAFRTDAEGGFRSSQLPGKIGSLLRAEAEGFAATELDLGTLEPGERREGLEMVLRPGSRGIGWVVDDRDQPVVGAKVRLTEESPRDRRFFRPDPDSVPTYTSDAEGRFVIGDLVAGRYDLEAEAVGKAPMTVRGIEVPEGATEVDLGTLVLAPGVDLEGLVVDSSGQPVAEARVVTSAVGEMDRQRMMMMLGQAEIEALSGRDGRFVIEDRAAGQTLEVLVQKEGFVSAAVGSVELPTKEPLRVVLRPASRVLGRVLDGDRRPVAEATVSAIPDGMTGRGRRLAPQATTGEDGTFEITDVEPGIVSVAAEASGFQALRLTGLEVPADAPLENLELVLKTGAVLTGTVVDAQGEPASGAMIFMMSSTGGGGRNFTQTDGEGRFRLDGLELGSAMVRAMLTSGPSVNKAVTIEPGENTVEIEVVDGVEVRGRVIAASGEPIEGAFIEVRNQAGRSFFQRDPVVSKAGGAFTIERVPAGRYVFRAQREGLAPGESEVTEVGDSPLDGIEIVLSAGQAIVGRVLGLDPELLPGVSIHLGRRWQRSVHPDFEGRYRLDELAPGDYTVVAEVEDNSRRLERRVTLEEGVAEVELDLEFGEGYLVTGTLFHGDGPLANAEVQLDGRDVDYDSAEVVSSHDGRFRFADVPAGVHQLTVRGRDTAVSHAEEVEIRGDEDLRIDIVSGVVAGRVVDDSGTPIDSVRLRLDRSEQGGASQWGESDSRGLFRFASVGEGNWRLEASRAGYRTVVEDLELSAGESREGLELRLATAAGLVLDLRAPGGVPPAFVYANFVDLTGRSVARDSFAADSQGRVLIDVVPEGSWRMILTVSGYALVDTQVTVPGDPREIALELEARLKISIPDLEESPSLARLRLVGPRGVRPWIGRETVLEEEQELNRPVLEVDGLAPGLWTATVTTEDGRTYSGQIQAVVGATTSLELR